MKKQILFVFGLMTIIIISCRKDELISGKETGRLIVDVGLSVHINEVNSRLKATPEPGDFKVIIYRADGTEVLVFETVTAMPDTIELEPGNYHLEAHSDNNIPAAFENPYYYGVSEIFAISSNTLQTVVVNCKLANTIVSVVYSDAVSRSFVDYSTTVSSILDSLVYMKDETRLGYFQSLPLEIAVKLTSSDPGGSESSRLLFGSIPNPLAGRHYQISVNTIIENGMGTFQVLLDETEIPVEILELTDNPVVPDSPVVPDDSVIRYGEILISEIMFDPDALSDSEGEWFEIYNNSDRMINLQNLVLGRDVTQRHTIAGSIELFPGQYFVLARTVTATDALNTYVYGSSILLPNNGAVLYIYNAAEGAEQGALIFSVNYGANNFPNRAGASITLNPSLMNAADAVSGTSWCLSSSVYNTGDAGTPGMVNDSCP